MCYDFINVWYSLNSRLFIYKNWSYLKNDFMRTNLLHFKNSSLKTWIIWSWLIIILKKEHL